MWIPPCAYDYRSPITAGRAGDGPYVTGPHPSCKLRDAAAEAGGAPRSLTRVAPRSEGVVTLLGDTACPVLAHTSQSVAQTIVDAVALGRALTEGADAADARQVYAYELRPKTAVLLAQRRRTAGAVRMTTPSPASSRKSRCAGSRYACRQDVRKDQRAVQART